MDSCLVLFDLSSCKSKMENASVKLSIILSNHYFNCKRNLMYSIPLHLRQCISKHEENILLHQQLIMYWKLHQFSEKWKAKKNTNGKQNRAFVMMRWVNKIIWNRNYKHVLLWHTCTHIYKLRWECSINGNLDHTFCEMF